MTDTKRHRKMVTPTNRYIPDKKDVVILDTNILITLFTPYSIGKKINYDVLWSRLLKSKCKLILSSIQISELINSCIRIQYNLYKERHGCINLDYKTGYRSTDDYIENMDGILSIISDDIQTHFSFIDDGFSKMQPNEIFKRGVSYDFNDALIAEMARSNKAILVTDDADFGNYQLDFKIVTSNNYLLSIA